LACKLGNAYGISWDAQMYLDSILNIVTKDRWIYYLGSVLSKERVILYKLTDDEIISRWIDIVDRYELSGLDAEFEKDIKEVLIASKNRDIRQLKNLVNRMLY